MKADDEKTASLAKRVEKASEPKLSWADVVEATAGQPATAEDEAKSDPHPAQFASIASAAPAVLEPLRPGDIVRHAKFGDCTVHRITEKPRFVHMARPNEKVRRLSLDIVEFQFLGIEGRCRIFTMKVKK